MANKNYLLYLMGLISVVMIGSLLAIGSEGQGLKTCGPPHDCVLDASCTVCAIGQTITFTLECTQGEFDEQCQPGEEFPDAECCIDTGVSPDPVYFQGTNPDGSSVGCQQASNPLSYTFQPGDEGIYTRSACVNSNCGNCSPYVTVTVE